MSNNELYGDLPRLSDKIRQRRLQFAGHCLRSSGQVVSNLVLWKKKHGKRCVGSPIRTYVDLLCQDTGHTPVELKTCMENRRVWRAISDVRQMSTEWVSESYNSCSENAVVILFNYLIPYAAGWGLCLYFSQSWTCSKWNSSIPCTCSD